MVVGWGCPVKKSLVVVVAVVVAVVGIPGWSGWSVQGSLVVGKQQFVLVPKGEHTKHFINGFIWKTALTFHKFLNITLILICCSFWP